MRKCDKRKDSGYNKTEEGEIKEHNCEANRRWQGYDVSIRGEGHSYAGRERKMTY